MAITDQCKAVLPNDRRMQYDDGYKCCSLRDGHEGPHRTGYNGAAACEGDPGWMLDVAAIRALPSAYSLPTDSDWRSSHLRDLGFEEPTAEQRAENLEHNLFMLGF